MLIPNQQVPDVSFTLLNEGLCHVSDFHDGRLLVLVLFRGYHCPICRTYLPQLDRLLPEYLELGVEVAALSMETAERTEKIRDEWQIRNLSLGFGLPEADARALGLYLSRGTTTEEPALYNEPALYLILPDRTLYASSVQTMPFVRPDMEELLGALKYILTAGYPARGDA